MSLERLKQESSYFIHSSISHKITNDPQMGVVSGYMMIIFHHLWNGQSLAIHNFGVLIDIEERISEPV